MSDELECDSGSPEHFIQKWALMVINKPKKAAKKIAALLLYAVFYAKCLESGSVARL